MNLNKVLVAGRLGADVELKSMGSGKSVANVNVATSNRWTDKSGQKQEKTEWHRVVVYGKNAENLAKYLKKGDELYVEGRLETRSWEDKDGKKRYSTEIVAQTVQFGNRKQASKTKEDREEGNQSEELFGEDMSDQNELDYDDV
jgi:single-strand DNA-binding protein